MSVQYHEIISEGDYKNECVCEKDCVYVIERESERDRERDRERERGRETERETERERERERE